MAPIRNVVEVERVTKKFCRNLKKSMWYGLGDLATEFTGGRHDSRVKLRAGEFFSLRNVSFHVQPGECVALLGPNGAGKSTMMKLLNGLLKPNSGRITIRGKTGALIELGAGFNPILSGRDNVFINGSVLGLSRQEVTKRFDEILEFSELGEFIDAPVKTYSSGMRVRLGYSVAAHLRPNLLLLDEVLAVGDVGFRMKCFEHLRQLRERGTAIILVSHAMAAVSRVAQRAVVFGKGQKVFDGELEAGIARYQELVGVQSAENRSDESEDSTGEAEIGDVVCVSERDPNSSDMDTGDTLVVRIPIKVNQPVKDARVILNLVSPVAGRLSAIPSSVRNLSLQLEPPGCVVEARFPNVPLLLGHYFFNIGLYGERDIDFIDRKMSAASFNIVGPPMAKPGFGITGTIALDHDWQVLPTP